MTKKQLKKEIEKIIALHEKMQRSYFFSSPASAAARRSYEADHSQTVTGEIAGHSFDFSCETKCSCKNVYYKGIFVIDGKKVTIKGVKKLLQSLL